MKLDNVAIPLNLLWASPFSRWQGSLQEVSSLDIAIAVTSKALAERNLDPGQLTGVVHGWSVPQPEIFYGAPYIAAKVGAPNVTGPMISQACATSVACVQHAAANSQSADDVHLVVCSDRISNGPTLLYPNPSGSGGAATVTHWVLDSFASDPWAGTSMLASADTVAAENGFTKEQADELKVQRYEQYSSALADDRAFQRTYMVPIEVQVGRKKVTLEADEGIRPVDMASISGLKPVSKDGIHSFAAQTHPADGAAGAVITTVERARELSGGAGVVELLATGTARVDKTHMPAAPVPAARSALGAAGVTIDQVDLVTTHNPFSVNDLYFSQQTGYPLDKMNVRGCSLIFGHPQGPTGLRSIAELVMELKARGGGVGLFTGCAAGDSSMALVLRVTD